MIPLLDALDMVGRIVITNTGPVDGEIILIMSDILAVNGIEITLTERKIMNRIHQVGLPYPVIADKTVDLVRELVVSLRIILKVR